MLKSLLTLLAIITPFTLQAAQAAVDTSVTYSSSILTLLFIGFCAFLIIMQLIPAILMLIGVTRAITYKDKQEISNQFPR